MTTDNSGNQDGVDQGGAGGGAAGGAAPAINPLTGEPAAGAAGAGGGSGGEQGGAGAGGAGASGGEAAAWWAELSGDAPDDKTLSDRAWIENKKFAAPADMVKSYRQLESQLGGEKLLMPKSAEDTEGWDRIYKAIGRPEAPDGYKFDAAKDVDPALTAAFAPIAHKLGLSQAMVDGVVAFNEQMVAQQDQQRSQAHAGEVAALRQQMGSEFDTTMERSLRAAERFGLDAEKVGAIRTAIGPKALITMLDNIGRQMGEDGLHGGGKRDLTMTADKAAQRKTEIKNDPVLAAKLRQGDPTLKAEWDAINAVEAAAEERQRAA